jgi:hypothetical protein
MSGFDDREKSFEAKFSHDEETKFRIRAHRDKLLGLWAAEQFGLSGAAAEAYANEIVASDVGQPRDDFLPEKLVSDANARRKPIDIHIVRREMRRLAEIARTDIMQGRT